MWKPICRPRQHASISISQQTKLLQTTICNPLNLNLGQTWLKGVGVWFLTLLLKTQSRAPESELSDMGLRGCYSEQMHLNILISFPIYLRQNGWLSEKVWWHMQFNMINPATVRWHAKCSLCIAARGNVTNSCFFDCSGAGAATLRALKLVLERLAHMQAV